MTGAKTHKPIYVIAGKDNFLVNRQCQKLLDDLIDPSDRDVCLFNADPAEVKIGDILDELRTAPLFADKRVVFIRSAENFISENRTLLEKYFDSPSPSGILIFVVASWPGNTKLAKKLNTVGELIGISQIKPWEMSRYITSYTKQEHSKNLQSAAAQLLVELVGAEAGALAAEIEKLAIYAAEKNSITTTDVEELVGHSRLFNAFSVIDAMTAGNTSAAIERLRRMFTADRNAGFTVVGAFAFHFRKMFGAKALLEKGMNNAQIAGKLKIWGNKEGFFSQVRKMTLKQIGFCLRQLAAIDHAIKTGKTQPQTAMEKLIIKLSLT